MNGLTLDEAAAAVKVWGAHNTRLVAKAPELLALARRVVAHFDMTPEHPLPRDAAALIAEIEAER